MLLITIMFFSKKRLKSKENQIYAILIITTMIGLSLEVSSAILSIYFNHLSLLKTILLKLIVLYFLSWIYEFFVYTFYISKSNDKITKNVFLICYFLLAFVTLVLPLYSKVTNGLVQYTYGPSVNFVYGISGILILGCLILMLMNFKNIKSKKYLPLFTFMFFGIVIAIIQAIFPNLILMSSMETFVTILMYFTIENPDLKMMEELYKNKKLIEKNNEDTSNFLFRITQDIKKPVKDIIEVSSNVDGDLKEKMKYINNTSISLDYLINDALDVSSMNTKRIKVYDTRYNALNLFKEEKYKFENRLNKNVKFNFTISNGIPEYLYGDSLKLKQVISSVLENALEHTEKGEITLDISSIIKYGICRLIISITDSGKGMGIEEINNILSLNSEDMAKIDLRNMDDKDLNLKEVKKLVALIGGNLMVKSEEGRGTEINIILEQKIVPTKETEITKKLESYEQSLYHNKKVMVVDDDAKELASITSYLEKNEAIVSGSLFGRDCIEKIEANMKYDLILLDDETDTYSALEVLKELKKNKKFNIPVVIMIDDSKEFIKLHYLQDGFSEVIMKSKLESEIDRIMKRF
jgi:signal transduction histidine kinase/CheY-like chemotaxis protein